MTQGGYPDEHTAQRPLCCIAFLVMAAVRLSTAKEACLRQEPIGLAQHLKRRRKSAGLTLPQAAAMVGVDRSSYCTWESGKGKPKPAVWPAIIAFVGRDPICENPETIASQIAAICRRCGLTRAKLAKHIAITVNKLRNWEIGRSKAPDETRSILAGLLEGRPSTLTAAVEV